MTATGVTGGDPTKVSKTGDTMTGPLILSGDPTAALGAGTKQYVDTHGGGGGGVQLGGDLGGSNASPSVTGSHFANPLPPGQGGTGQATLQLALNALAGSVASGRFLRGDGTNVSLAPIQAGDLPASVILTGDAAATVQSGSSYGTAGAVGTLATYAREDHQHGTPPLSSAAPATTLAIGTAASAGTAIAPSRADHVHPVAASGVPGASAVGDTASAGSASSFAASDHKHGREAFGTAGNSAVGDAASPGTAATLSHSDHIHGREAFGPVTPLTSFGTASGNGTASTLSRSDHVHGAPNLTAATTGAAGIVQIDGTAADYQPIGVGSAGSVGRVADAGHVHPYQPWQFPITAYGAKGDLQCVFDGSMTSGSNIVQSASANWTPAATGMPIVIKGALSSGQTSLIGTITGYTSPTQITVSVNASVSGTGMQVVWGTDNTTAIQAAINAAQAYDGGPFGIAAEVITPPAIGAFGYMIAGALKTSDGVNAFYNSQLTIGLNSGRSAGRVLAFVGAEDAGNTRFWDQDYPFFQSSTWFSAGAFSSLGNQQASISAAGNPSCLGGPTGTSGYGGTGTDPLFNNITVVMRDMAIMNTHSASGFTYSPFNFHGMARAHLDRCAFGTAGVVQYYKNQPGLGDFATVSTLSGGVSIGGLMPAAGNNASNRIRDCVWNGGYTFGPLWTEHTVGEGVNTILYCWGGFCPVGTYGDGGTGAGALHAILAGQLCVEGCSYHVVVWGGGQSNVGPIVHAVIDTEGTVQMRDNPNNGTGLNSALGEIRMTGASSAPQLTFATGMRIIREQIKPGVNGAPPALVANTAVLNSLWRPATVYLAGGANLTTVQVSNLAGGASAAVSNLADFTSAGTIAAPFPVRLGPGQWIKINTSSGTTLPTATWVLD